MIKNILKGLGIFFLILIALLIILPYAFRGRIVEYVKQQANEQLDADVDFGRTGLSVFRSFPDMTLRVDDLSVVNHAPFAGDTLAGIDRLFVTIDLRSLFGRDAYEIKRLRLDSPRFVFRLLDDGTANWDIMKAVEPDDEPDPLDEPADFDLTLQRISIGNGSLMYHDDKFLTYVDLTGLDGVLRADLGMTTGYFTTRDTRIGSFSLRYDRYPILSNASVELDAEVDVDLEQWVFRFHDNRLLVNALPLSFDGMVALPDAGGTLMDFSFEARRSGFAAFLSLVPALYAREFDELETGGQMALRGHVDGLLQGDFIPAFDLLLEVSEGMFLYPGMPAAVSGVNVDASIRNPGNTFDEVEIDLPVIRMDLGGNPVEGRFLLRTPESDPWVDMALLGRLDLGELQQVFPLEEGSLLEGLLESNLEARGHLSDLEAGQYQQFHAAGSLTGSGVRVTSPMLTQVIELDRFESAFNPEYFELTAFELRLGESDLSATGRIDNLLHYALEGQLLTGAFDVVSEVFDLNQLMEQLPEPTGEDEPMQLSMIHIPANIDFSLQSAIRQLHFGEMRLRNVGGRIRVVDERAELDPLRMDLFGGELSLSGSYSTAGDLPDVSFGLDFTSWDIAEAFNTFHTVRILAPVAGFVEGRLSGSLSLNARLYEDLQPVLETLSGGGRLRSAGVVLNNHPVLVSLAERTYLDMFRELPARDVSLAFSFADGKVDIPPLELNLGRTTAALEGTTYFDRRIDYAMRVEVPRDEFGSRANQMLDNLLRQAADVGIRLDPGDYVPLDVRIEGTVSNPEIRVAMPGVFEDVDDRLRGVARQMVRDAEERVRDEADRLREEAEEQLREAVDERREQVQEELDARARALEEEAERRAASIRREAAAAAERVRTEARHQAERLVEEATSPVAVAAARRAGEALIREADQRAAQMEAEADRRADQLLEEARRKAERIRRGEEE